MMEQLRKDQEKVKTDSEEKVIPTTCNTHCGGTCLLKVHVRDGKITKIETDDSIEPQLRACLRGRAFRQRVYAPDRLKFPMKRIGIRGEGKFVRISWDEALDTITRELKRVNETYGPQSILYKAGGGNLSLLHGYQAMAKLLNMMGGYTKVWSYPSFEGGIAAALATYGTMVDISSKDDLLNSKLIISWAWDPANTIGGTNSSWYLAQAREAGVRIISVDPRYTDSTATFASQWIPIRPGTDAAMLVAMAYVIISRNLQNQTFLDTYTVGFDEFKDYILGIEDGIKKTPAWAESITKVPAATIEELAINYATTKPAALLCGIAPGRTAYGEQYHRVAITLAAMTGNIGIHGGNLAGRVWTGNIGGHPFIQIGGHVLRVPNPVEQETSRRENYLLGYENSSISSAQIHAADISDAILKGKSGGYPTDYKFLYTVNASYPNQDLNINKSVKALQKLEFVVVHEQFMTPGAKYADILLPISTLFERNDITTGFGTLMYGFMNKVIEPIHECKSSFEIAVELAAKLHISNFNDRTEDEWLREIMKHSTVLDYDKFKKRGFYKVPYEEPYVPFEDQIKDPSSYRFPTPSGKIEIYSQQLADMNHPQIPPIPKYIEPWESPSDNLAITYPLQLITTHFKRRAHSQWETIPWLRELVEQTVSINSLDAEARGIKNGDEVFVYNDRGKMIIQAKVTERIMPGVVDIPQGAWYNPDEKGVDRGGSVNILTRDESSPCGSFPSNTCLVQIEKV
ncbi:molybdopterin-dependent oxidoreductase [Chloroflexota bacterium]